MSFVASLLLTLSLIASNLWAQQIPEDIVPPHITNADLLQVRRYNTHLAEDLRDAIHLAEETRYIFSSPAERHATIVILEENLRMAGYARQNRLAHLQTHPERDPDLPLIQNYHQRMVRERMMAEDGPIVGYEEKWRRTFQAELRLRLARNAAYQELRSKGFKNTLRRCMRFLVGRK